MLKKVKSKPLIRYVHDKCLKAKYFKKIYVATCDRKIFNEIKMNGGHVIMTNIFHKGCVSRIAEAVEKEKSINKNDFICIVQGDEVQVDYKMLDKFSNFILKKKKKYSIFNVLSKIKNDDEYKSKSVIKALLDNNKNIINFSRTNVTYGIKSFNKDLSKKVLRQTGIIAIRKDFLIRYSKMKRSFFEIKESVDMLRYIENEFKIHSYIINKTMIGIDTPKDYYKFINS